MAQFIENQPITPITREELAATAVKLCTDGWRLVHVAATTLSDAIEVTYAFDRDCILANYRVMVPKADPTIPSISATFLAAFTYENELQDLFGITVPGLVLDFKGNFYRKMVAKPFNPDKPAATQPAAGTQPTGAQQ
jgi:ech hydrogenase subunit D